MVAPLVSKWKLAGRCSETGSLNRSRPCSDSRMISAAMTVFVMLAIENCERAWTGCTPSAVPAAPDHAPPSATNTVAVTPGSPSCLTAASRTACRARAVESETEPVGTSGKCPRVYATPTRDGDGECDGVGLEPACVEEVQALVNSPTTTTKDARYAVHAGQRPYASCGTASCASCEAKA